MWTTTTTAGDVEVTWSYPVQESTQLNIEDQIMRALSKFHMRYGQVKA